MESSSTPKKRKSLRSKSKYPALEVKFSLKSRTELVDYDYVGKLSEEEKKWLNDFTSEEIHASVNRDGRKNRFNKKKKDIKKVYDANNARNRCTWTKEKAKGIAQYLEEHRETLIGSNPEDYIAVKMDLEQAGWIDEEGNVLTTELEEIKKAILIEKKSKRLSK